MIKCNLAVLLAERNLRISELSKRTGISRTTLTSLAQNQSKGIQFDTFDTLCNYLKIAPNDLFSQEKFEYDFLIVAIEKKNAYEQYQVIVETEVEFKTQKITININCDAEIFEDTSEPATIAVKILFPEEISEIFKSIPILFKTYFEEELLDCIKAEMVARFNLEEDVTIHSW